MAPNQTKRVLVRYADKTLYDGPWSDAPIWDAQTVAFFDEQKGYPEFRWQGDYYHLADDDTIIGVDIATVMCHMARQGIEPPGDTAAVTLWASQNGYKIASYVGDNIWQELYQLGKKDRDALRQN